MTALDHTASQEKKSAADELRADDIGIAFKRLDALLARAIEAAKGEFGAGTLADGFRGLYIHQNDAQDLLSREPGASPFAPVENPGSIDTPPFRWLRENMCLDSFDLDVVVITLAPELDLRYERLYAYLQDDITRKRPTVDLVLNLLCATLADKLQQRAHFAFDAPLASNGVIELVADPNQVQPPLLAHYLKLDEQITRFILGQPGLDRRLAPFYRMVEPRSLPGQVALAGMHGLTGLLRAARVAGTPVRLYFHGPRGIGKRRAAEALAAEIGMPLLVADLNAIITVADPKLIKLGLQAGRLNQAVVYLDGWDAARQDEHSLIYEYLLSSLQTFSGIVILGGTLPWTTPTRAFGEPRLGILDISFPIPGAGLRREYWRESLEGEGITLLPERLDELASRFSLTRSQIGEAAATARSQAEWREAGGSDRRPEKDQAAMADLFAAVRAQCGHALARLTRKIEPLYTWKDIVLPDDAMAQLHEICERVVHRDQVLSDWGFAGKLSQGKGINALFAGPSGVGKTMAAEVIANELGLDLYKIDLSGVVSKYIGETEKNLDRIFTAAENANAILFFDEADALFGKRSEVRDSHDRYANVEIAYLLQKMEQYEGIAILATNLRGNLDESFTRRLAFTVHFPFPDEESRRRIWESIFPRQVPLAGEVNLEWLTRQFKLSGGNIKNIALAAAYLAAQDGGEVTMAHVRHAVRREYQKLGKVLSDAELGV